MAKRLTVRNIGLLNLVAICCFVSACMIVPKQVSRYDADCNIHYKQLRLTEIELNNFNACNDEACLVVLLAIPVASTIISGSIVIAGNVVYWLEKEGRCLLKDV